MKILKKIYNLLPRTRVRQIPMIIVLMIIGAGFEVLGVGLVIPLLELISNTDESLIGLDFRNIGSLNQEEVIILCLTIFASVYVIKGLYLSFLLWLFGRYTFNTKAEISNNLMESYMSAQYEFHLENNSAQLIRNLTIESNQLASFALIPLLTILTEGFMMLSIVIFLIWLEPLGTLFVMATVIPLSFIFQKVLAGYSTELGRARQKADGFVIQKSQEALGGIKDAKVLNKTDYFVESFCQQNLKSAFFFW
ncbi:MAG: ABC transporter transmembrane domain-containing protein [Pseudomonadota bacterium]|nr:ABC transporter transmembrane domain-containing protein [Pseudomonadota bacterium]